MNETKDRLLGDICGTCSWFWPGAGYGTDICYGRLGETSFHLKGCGSHEYIEYSKKHTT